MGLQPPLHSLKEATSAMHASPGRLLKEYTDLLSILGLEGTARYAYLLLAPAQGFDLLQRFFLLFGQKRAFDAVFANFRPFLVFISSLSNFR